jgi:ATP-dependent DNA ligase
MHDGYRLMARVNPVGIRLLTRNGHDWSPRYPLIIEAVNALKSRSFIKVVAVAHFVKCAEEERVQFRVGNIQIRSLSGFL